MKYMGTYDEIMWKCDETMGKYDEIYMGKYDDIYGEI